MSSAGIPCSFKKVFTASRSCPNQVDACEISNDFRAYCAVHFIMSDSKFVCALPVTETVSATLYLVLYPFTKIVVDKKIVTDKISATQIRELDRFVFINAILIVYEFNSYLAVALITFVNNFLLLYRKRIEMYK